MAQAFNLDPDPNKVRDASVAAIAKETETSRDIVKALYEEEVAALNTQATVRQYVAVIATKRVKEQLRALDGPH